jgi:lipoyl(octanoyl) transferase
MKVLHSSIGQTHFSDAWEIQRSVLAYKQKNPTNDVILSTEHFPVYTLGKTGERNHLLINDDELGKKEIEYFEIDRGGDITYHGPGQLVVYPIFDLNNYYKDTHRYLRDLEETVILTLDNYNIKSCRDEEYTESGR